MAVSRALGGRKLIISDFAGTITTKTHLDTNSLCFSRVPRPIARLERELRRSRNENLAILKKSGLLSSAEEAGWHFPGKNWAQTTCLHEGGMDCIAQEGEMGGKRIPIRAIPSEFGYNLEKYYGRDGPTAQQFFSVFLLHDSEIERAVASAKTLDGVYEFFFKEYLAGRIDELKFHYLIDLIAKKFLNKGQIDSAIEEMRQNHVRKSAHGLFSAAEKTGAHVVFCSFSYIEVIRPLVHMLAPSLASKNRMSFVANTIRYENGNNGGIASIERIGDKWVALDGALHAAGIRHKKGRYEKSVGCEDSEYNLPHLSRRVELPILIAGGDGDACQKNCRNFSNLVIFDEKDGANELERLIYRHLK